MKFIKTSLRICCQNFRKWQTDYRIWTILILLFTLVYEQTHDLASLGRDLGVKSSLWYYPFLYSQYHMKLIFTLPLLMVFCNAPFIDDNAMFIIVRSKRKAWILGQIIYIVAVSAVYNLFILFSVFVTSIPSAEISTNWGKLLNTISVSNASLSAGYPFLSASRFVITWFTPLQAVWFTFLLSWLMSIMIGMLVYFFNSITNTKSVGVTVCSLIIIFSCYIEVFGNNKMLWFSPVSWCTLDKLDVGGKTSNPSFYYCIAFFLIIEVLLSMVLLAFNRKWILDKAHR